MVGVLFVRIHAGLGLEVGLEVGLELGLELKLELGLGLGVETCFVCVYGTPFQIQAQVVAFIWRFTACLGLGYG